VIPSDSIFKKIMSTLKNVLDLQVDSRTLNDMDSKVYVQEGIHLKAMQTRINLCKQLEKCERDGKLPFGEAKRLAQSSTNDKIKEILAKIN
jgi:hypothetical protein